MVRVANATEKMSEVRTCALEAWPSPPPSMNAPRGAFMEGEGKPWVEWMEIDNRYEP